MVVMVPVVCADYDAQSAIVANMERLAPCFVERWQQLYWAYLASTLAASLAARRN